MVSEGLSGSGSWRPGHWVGVPLGRVSVLTLEKEKYGTLGIRFEGRLYFLLPFFF